MPATPLRLTPLAATLILLLSSPAQAQVQSPDGERAEREPKTIGKVEVVAEQEGYDAAQTRSATKTDTPLIDIPQSVTVITQQAIKDQAMQGLADVVRYVPGVGMAQGEGNRDTPILRGNSSTADMFVDGMRDDTQYYRDLYNIERVEVLKGPNAMIFGRGGTGGLINRVSRLADNRAHREASLQLGSWNKRRSLGDFGDTLGDSASFRVSAMVEKTGSYRDGVDYERWGLNPTVNWNAGANTTLTFSLEHFEEERVADRGVSSFLGRPVKTDPSTFFGDAGRSPVTADVDAFNAVIEHRFGNGLTLRNQTRAARYDKFYQNIFPGAVDGNGTTVRIQAYNNRTDRSNLFNQTDLTWNLDSGAMKHTLLFGMEFGRQVTDNFRNTGYFGAAGSSATFASVPLSDPLYTGPVEFRQSASDADNHSIARVAAFYVQDQIEFSDRWQVLLGLRYDRFESELTNYRRPAGHAERDLSGTDNLLSPRLGLIYKPVDNLSFYGSYGIGYLPRSGEQLGSLSLSNQALDPEEFGNIELGAKWDIHPDLSLTAAVYELKRSNVAIANPSSDPDEVAAQPLVLLSGDAQRMRGVEIGIAGRLTDRWTIMGGYAWQKGETMQEIRSSATATPLPAGTVLPQVPRNTLSLWNRFDVSERWGFGLGAVHRDRVYASTSNAVVLPAYTRFDGAVFFNLSDNFELQLNIENLFDTEYYASAHTDTNITPGSPRAFNLGLRLKY